MFAGNELSEQNFNLLNRLSQKRRAYTFDEVTLSDRPSEIHPLEVNLNTYVSRGIRLKGCGIISAAMDTVTEKELALVMAKMGGMGIIHCNLPIKEQVEQVKWVRFKIHEGGMIEKPITFLPHQRVSVIQNSIKENGWTFTSFPVVDEEGKLLGLVTRDELNFVETTNPFLKDVMRDLSIIVTAPKGTSTDEAYCIMKHRRVKKLPVVTEDKILLGMYVWNDVRKDQRRKELFSIDKDGHFLVGAAIGAGPEGFERAQMLVNEAGCKVLVLDSSHGSCRAIKNQIASLRKLFFSSIEIIAGNIASYESAMFLLDGEAKPDALKVGIGPGSICTTREVTGHGIPQITAIFECWKAVNDFGKRTGYYVPVIADGGIKNSGDIVKSLAAGASAIMLGNALAGTLESPGKIVVKNGKTFKCIRGMGSRAAMEERHGSRSRYYRVDDEHQGESITAQQAEKIVPEGVEGLVELVGDVESVMTRLLGGVQAGLAHSGATDIPSFQKRAQLWIQTFAGLTEGKPHDITDIRK